LAFEKLDDEDLCREYFGDVGSPICYDWDIGRAFATFLKLSYFDVFIFTRNEYTCNISPNYWYTLWVARGLFGFKLRFCKCG
jgi:hypothetical protein